MGFLIRMAFWFSLVLLALPLGATDDGSVGVSPIQAFFAAKAAVGDVAGICKRKPDVCEVGKAAMHTIGVRARESARIAYEMLEQGTSSEPTPDAVDALIASQDEVAAEPMDSGATGSIPLSR